MPAPRDVQVHLMPGLVAPERLANSVSVIIDVLRATTTIVYALAAGCDSVRPCAEIDEAKNIADGMRAGHVLLGGERDGIRVDGFDLGNSPSEYTADMCRGRTVVFTTTNGTRALLHALHADEILCAAFVNYSAVCERIAQDQRPIHFICAGTAGEPTLEDTLLAGAFVDFLCENGDVQLNDSARLAWDCFENHGRILDGALEISRGGSHLLKLGMGDDLKAAGRVDKFTLVPELKREPLRIEIGHIGICKKHW